MPGVEQQVMTKAHALITPVNSQHAKQDTGTTSGAFRDIHPEVLSRTIE